LALARKDRGRTVVFLAVGFETTAPATAATILEARQGGVENFTILDGHKLVVPAMEALLSAGEVPIDGFLCPGHVSVIIGAEAYRPVVEKYHKPCVVAGFEAEAMVAAILAVVTQHAAGEARIENEYGPVVSGQGNAAARAMIERVFAPADASWRAMGTLPGSGLALREEFADFDACGRLGVEIGPDIPAAGCRCGEVIQGKVLPKDCPQFGKGCTPTRPIGPCMVSSEGACAAWFKYGS
jgi:hydrogenase expression/formation protein HypD